MVQLFNPQLSEMRIDRTDPIFVFRLPSSVYTNCSDHAKKNNGRLLSTRVALGRGVAADQSTSCRYPALMAKVPQQLSSNCDHNMVIYSIIGNLVEDSKLESAHIHIHSRYHDNLAKVTFAYIERGITSIRIEESARPAKLMLKLLRRTRLLRWPHSTLRKNDFTLVENMPRIGLSRPYRSHPATDTESPD
jgi:hypothetical protein